MLYVSSRDRNDTYTAHVALTCDHAKDEGRFLPFQIPAYTNEEIWEMKNKSFNQIVADILNLYFSARLTAWDVDFCIGKQTCKVIPMSHKILVSELWHNPDTDFDRAIKRVAVRLLGNNWHGEPSLWLRSAMRIAVLFGTYGQALGDGSLKESVDFDVIVPAENMVWPIAATIAKKMGLPIGTIVCSASGESHIWDLIHKGTMSTAALPENIRNGVEAMLQLHSTAESVLQFVACCEKGKGYDVGEENPFSGCYYCTVAGKNRPEQSINSIFRSNQYIVDPGCAVSFSGLQDYRAGTGAGRMAMLFSENSPLNHTKVIAEATGVKESAISQYVKL